MGYATNVQIGYSNYDRVAYFCTYVLNVICVWISPPFGGVRVEH